MNSTKSLTSSISNKSPLSPTTPILSPSSKIVPSIGSKTPNILSPTTPSGTSKSKRRRDREARKNSQHYQESDILDSYYRSSPGDKISDYEDIWNTTDQSNHSTWSPNEKAGRNEKVVNPGDRLPASNVQERLSDQSERCGGDRLTGTDQFPVKKDRFLGRSEKFVGNNAEKLSYKEVTSPEFSSFKPFLENHGLKYSESVGSPEENCGGMGGKRPDLLSRVCKLNFANWFFALSEKRGTLKRANFSSYKPLTTLTSSLPLPLLLLFLLVA